MALSSVGVALRTLVKLALQRRTVEAPRLMYLFLVHLVEMFKLCNIESRLLMHHRELRDASTCS